MMDLVLSGSAWKAATMSSVALAGLGHVGLKAAAVAPTRRSSSGKRMVEVMSARDINNEGNTLLQSQGRRKKPEWMRMEIRKTSKPGSPTTR